MKTEKEKMLAGELYDAHDPELASDRKNARVLFKQFNDSNEDEKLEREQIIKALIPFSGANLWIEPPFYCDYGKNITIGDDVFFNFNCVVLDVAKVTIGSRTLFGPNVQIYTATHPIGATLRASGLESGQDINIGNDVWVGGSAVICPGVTIGDRAVIGAGSVVIKDIPADVIAGGNPCKIIRLINQD